MTKKLDLQEVISRFKEVHGDKYDYSLVEYEGATKKVKIICPVHGVIEQTPSYHLISIGCSKCGNSTKSSYKKGSNKSFILDANGVHNNRYDYSEVNYRGCDDKVKIICKEHGEFYQTPYAHVKMKQGCPECGKILSAKICKEKISLTTEEFISKSIEKHGNLYDYSLVNYVGINTPVKIICKIHGEFLQKPVNHLYPAGCQKCAKRGFKVNEVGALYIIQAGYITKVGITSGKVADRCSYISRKSGLDFKVIDNYNMAGHLCRDIEQIVLKYLKSKYQRPEEYFHGYSECFYDVDVEELQSFIQQTIKDMT